MMPQNDIILASLHLVKSFPPCLVRVGVQALPHDDTMLATLVAYLHIIKYAYKLLLSVSMHFVLPHDRVKPVYKSQTIGAYHGGRPRKSVQSTLTLINLIMVWLRVLGLITYKHTF